MKPNCLDEKMPNQRVQKRKPTGENDRMHKFRPHKTDLFQASRNRPQSPAIDEQGTCSCDEPEICLLLTSTVIVPLEQQLLPFNSELN